MAHWDSNGHVTDDGTWPRKVKVMTPIYLAPLSRQWLETRTWCQTANGAPIGNDYLAIKWSRDRWRHLTLKGQGRASIYLSPNILKTDRDRDLVQWTTNRKWPIGFIWSREWWRYVTQKGEGHGPKIFRRYAAIVLSPFFIFAVFDV